MTSTDRRPRTGSGASHGSGLLNVVNPSTGKVFTSVPAASPAELDQLLVRAQTAFGGWRHDDSLRRHALRGIADTLSSSVDELARLLALELGRPLKLAAMEVHRAAAWFTYFADLDQPLEVIQDDEGALVELVRRPLGVVGAITPWNYPLLTAAWKLAPALRAGNTVVLKSSPFTPLATAEMLRRIAGVLPADVAAGVTGGDDLGRRLASHPIPRKITLTGSTAAGVGVASSGASDLKRLTLELGGNDAAIVLSDADVEAVSGEIFEAAFRNNGQVCTAIKRVYVDESIKDGLVAALADRAHTVVVGDAMDPASELGPVANEVQLARVDELVQDAIESGGSAAAGGGRIDREGYFFAPTIVTDVSNGVRLVDEEQFGPALPIIGYTDVDQAVASANDSALGLGGSVWSPDLDRAVAIADQLDVGTTWVNTHGVVNPHQPFGGAKWSGIGVENGLPGLQAFTQSQIRYRRR